MKREDIKKILPDITDEILNKIMDINGKDIEKSKNEAETYKTQTETLKQQLSDRDKQLKELKEQIGDNDALKTKITELETENQNAKAEYENKVKELTLSNAVDSALRDARAKNVKAVKALLDMEKIEWKEDKLSGLDEQLQALVSGEDTAFMFEESETKNKSMPNGFVPAGGGAPNGKTVPDFVTLNEAVAKALSSQAK